MFDLTIFGITINSAVVGMLFFFFALIKYAVRLLRNKTVKDDLFGHILFIIGILSMLVTLFVWLWKTFF